MSRRKPHKYEKLCADVMKQIAALAPESEPSVYGLAVLTRAGWLQAGCSYFDDHITLCTRFEEPTMSKRATPSNIKQILAVIAKQCDDRDMAEFWAEEINHSCENADDMFGTEGQSDPRGDQRR